MSPHEAVVAVDIGGTTTKSALVGVDGRILATDVRATEHGEAAQRAVSAATATQASRARTLGARVVGAGVVSPGIIDEASGVVRYASNLGWRGVSLRDLLTTVLDAPVGVGHDARSAGIAEGVFGAVRGQASYVHVSIGTGIAASLVVAGRAVSGHEGGAGELGHTPVHPGGEPCPCGQRGCLEVYASGAGLARRYEQRTGTARTAAQVAARLEEDRAAGEVWSEGARALALGLATCTQLLDPQTIVIAGGLAQAGDLLLAPVRAGLAELLRWREAPTLVVTTLGTDAARLGAALVAMQAAGLADRAAAWDLGATGVPAGAGAAGG
ncbi:ROK family protein [Georgenia satyanarayanai]|uniref:ROK family protein n=1 Tax=Georgenia satyanarayanai TaxID=860221 RepID=UPI00126520F1|nr:ROK family protein [Georgenia satyanarayanai]